MGLLRKVKQRKLELLAGRSRPPEQGEAQECGELLLTAHRR